MLENYPITVKLDSDGNILELHMPRPSNFHAHLRQEELMRAVAYQIMRWVRYLLVMPNSGPIDTIKKVIAYYEELTELAELNGTPVTLVMTVYFTEKLTSKVIEQLARLPFRCEVKWYPPHRGATTGSGHGIHFREAPETLEAMTDFGIRFLGHFESVEDRYGHPLPHKEREGYFMQNEFPWIRDQFPDLQICIEHASTKLAVEAVMDDPWGKTVCTITPQHLLFTEEDLRVRSWKNHLKCMPFVKTAEDREALIRLATSGDQRAILGDDTAPHPSRAKSGTFEDAACGCWLPHSLSLYIMAFKMAGALDERFIKFACLNGARWRGLPLPDPTDRICVRREVEYDVPNPTLIPETDDVVIPLGWTDEADRIKIGHALAEI